MVCVCVVCVLVGAIHVVVDLCVVSVFFYCECLCGVVWLMWCVVICCVFLCVRCVDVFVCFCCEVLCVFVGLVF